MIVLSPILLLIALAVKLTDRGPVLYRQVRIGLGGHRFTIIKFRTMSEEAEVHLGPIWSVPNDPRCTRIGLFLRRYGLDELPQLWNILRGEMSVVGPRPERPEFVKSLEKDIPFYNERHLVKPGVSGWAQVRFKYGASVSDSFKKLEYDFFYIKNRSIFLDLAI